VASFDGAIPPGQVGKVTAQVRTENYRGPVEKTVTVTSSDPARPSVLLRVKANVVGSVVILPGQFLSFPAPPTWDYAGKVLIRKDKTESGELKVSDVTTTAPWLTAKARRVENPEPEAEGFPAALPGDWVLDVTVSEAAPSVQSGQQVRFKSGLPREAEVTVPVSVVMQKAMYAVPESVLVPVLAGSQEATGLFKVVLRPGLAKETVHATVAPTSFSVTLERDGDRHYRGKVVWKGTGENGERTGSVVLTVGGETLNLPVRVVERAAAAAPRPPAPAGPALSAGSPGPPVSLAPLGQRATP